MKFKIGDRVKFKANPTGPFGTIESFVSRTGKYYVRFLGTGMNIDCEACETDMILYTDRDEALEISHEIGQHNAAIDRLKQKLLDIDKAKLVKQVKVGDNFLVRVTVVENNEFNDNEYKIKLNDLLLPDVWFEAKEILQLKRKKRA